MVHARIRQLFIRKNRPVLLLSTDRANLARPEREGMTMATGKRYVYGKQYLTETIPRLLEEMWIRLRAHEMCQGFWKRH